MARSPSSTFWSWPTIWNFFPAYEAVWLYRADLAQRYPPVIESCGGSKDASPSRQMQQMNTAVQTGKRERGRHRRGVPESQFGIEAPTSDGTLAGRVLTTTGEHLLLVIPSLLAALLVAIPLGVVAARRPRIGRVILACVGVLQTIPSLALLLFMIPLLMWLIGQGTAPARHRGLVLV